MSYAGPIPLGAFVALLWRFLLGLYLQINVFFDIFEIVFEKMGPNCLQSLSQVVGKEFKGIHDETGEILIRQLY